MQDKLSSLRRINPRNFEMPISITVDQVHKDRYDVLTSVHKIKVASYLRDVLDIELTAMYAELETLAADTVATRPNRPRLGRHITLWVTKKAYVQYSDLDAYRQVDHPERVRVAFTKKIDRLWEIVHAEIKTTG